MVLGPDGFDLLGCDRVPPGTQSLANGARLVFWMMKEIDENVDDTSGMQFLGSRWRGEFLSFRPLPGSWLRLGAEVDVDASWNSLRCSSRARTSRRRVLCTRRRSTSWSSSWV